MSITRANANANANANEEGERTRTTTSSHSGATTWNSSRLLALFCATALVVYTDRGAISSAAVSGTPRTTENPHGSGLQGALDASYAKFGALTAAFMVGLLAGAPAFSALAREVNPFRLISYGMMIYACGEIGCACAISYWVMFACRCAVGVGEASFVSLAAPFIDDHAPAGRKTLWLATFYLCVPFGVAFGIFFGGAVAPKFGWRAPFAMNACAAAPIAVYCWFSPPVRMRGVSDNSSAAGLTAYARSSSTLRDRAGAMFSAFAKDCSDLARFPVYVFAVCGYAFYTAVIGVYAVWGPKAGYAIFSRDLVSASNADMVLGGVTVLSGILGTLFGGMIVDTFGSTLKTALRTCACSAFAGFVFMEIAFTQCSSFAMFLLVFIAGEVSAFVLQAPINAVVLWSVEPRLRPLACSMTTVVIHLFGDVPTPVLFGHFLERDGAPSPDRWRAVCAAFTLLLVASSFVLAGASLVADQAIDHRRADSILDGDSDTEFDVDVPGAASEADVQRARLIPD